MMRYAEPVVVNHNELCRASGCESLCYVDPGVWESWCFILSQLGGNHGVNAVPVGVNHGELC